MLRYGSTRNLCLGLEVVFADGSIWNSLSRLHKDNTGYDLKNLIIGSEGTLGIITAATMKLFPKPLEHTVALIAVKSPKEALKLLSETKDYFGETISAFELINRMGVDFLNETKIDIKVPFLKFRSGWCYWILGTQDEIVQRKTRTIILKIF